MELLTSLGVVDEWWNDVRPMKKDPRCAFMIFQVKDFHR